MSSNGGGWRYLWHLGTSSGQKKTFAGGSVAATDLPALVERSRAHGEAAYRVPGAISSDGDESEVAVVLAFAHLSTAVGRVRQRPLRRAAGREGLTSYLARTVRRLRAR